MSDEFKVKDGSTIDLHDDCAGILTIDTDDKVETTSVVLMRDEVRLLRDALTKWLGEEPGRAVLPAKGFVAEAVIMGDEAVIFVTEPPSRVSVVATRTMPRGENVRVLFGTPTLE